MKSLMIAALVSMGLAGCTATAPPGGTSEVAGLRAQLKALQDEKTLLNLKLQDEIERSTIQLFLTRQEISVAQRELAALRSKCGAAAVVQ